MPPPDQIIVSPGTEAPAIDAANAAQDDGMLSYIAGKVADHQCVLFLGAAVHSPSPEGHPCNYTRDKCPPTGRALSELLAEKSGFPADQDRTNLQRVSQHFESKLRSRYILVEEIEKAVHKGREPSPILRALVAMEFPIVITTNYDHLYETALDLKVKQENPKAKDGAGYDVCIYSPNNKVTAKTEDCDKAPDPKRPYILKMHGDLSKEESIVVTDEDYIQFVLRMTDKHPYHPVGKNVLTHLIKWPTLFIGYRLTDYNLRLLFKTLRWRLDSASVPPAFSVDLQPDVLIRDVYENQLRYITFIEKNLWDFVPALYRAVKQEEMPC